MPNFVNVTMTRVQNQHISRFTHEIRKNHMSLNILF